MSYEIEKDISRMLITCKQGNKRQRKEAVKSQEQSEQMSNRAIFKLFQREEIYGHCHCIKGR